MTTQHGDASGIGGHLSDPFQRLQLPLPRKAEAWRDALLPVAGRVSRISGQKNKPAAAVNDDRRLPVGVPGDIDQLDTFISKQIDGPVVRSQRRAAVIDAFNGLIIPQAPGLPGLIYRSAGPEVLILRQNDVLRLAYMLPHFIFISCYKGVLQLSYFTDEKIEAQKEDIIQGHSIAQTFQP